MSSNVSLLSLTIVSSALTVLLLECRAVLTNLFALAKTWRWTPPPLTSCRTPQQKTLQSIVGLLRQSLHLNGIIIRQRLHRGLIQSQACCWRFDSLSMGSQKSHIFFKKIMKLLKISRSVQCCSAWPKRTGLQNKVCFQ